MNENKIEKLQGGLEEMSGKTEILKGNFPDPCNLDSSSSPHPETIPGPRLFALASRNENGKNSALQLLLEESVCPCRHFTVCQTYI